MKFVHRPASAIALAIAGASVASAQTCPSKPIGTADAMNALLSKQIDFMCDQTTNTPGQIYAGTSKGFAVTSRQRLAALPKLPTTDEAGLRGFEVGVWNGVDAPKGTAKAVTDKLVEAVRSAAKEPDVVRRMGELGATVYPTEQITPAALSAQLKAEIDKWGPIIKKAGV